MPHSQPLWKWLEEKQWRFSTLWCEVVNANRPALGYHYLVK